MARRIVTGQDISEPNVLDIATLQEIWDAILVLQNSGSSFSGLFTDLSFVGSSLTSLATRLHSDLQVIGANDHHSQVHALSGADHSGLLLYTSLDFTLSNLTSIATRLHSSLQGIGANDHHNQLHAIGGVDHSGSLAFTALDFTGSNLTSLATRSHANLQNLTADDHTDYFRNTGRVGGQIGYGGTNAADTLTFGSNATGTKTKIFFGSLIAFDELNTRLGIGTASPLFKLHMADDSLLFVMMENANAFGIGAAFTSKYSRGTVALPTAVQNNDILASYVFNCTGNISSGTSAKFNVVVDGTYAGDDYSSRFEFHTKNATAAAALKWSINGVGHLTGVSGVGIIESYTKKSCTIVTETFMQVANHLKIPGTDRIAIEGTGRLIVT